LQWRTDVFVSNHNSVSKSVVLTFYIAGASPAQRTFAMSPFSALSFPDIVLNTFGLASAAGELEVASSNQSAIEARARIYNNGNAAGEFGQNVPGIGRSWLRNQALLYGLSGINGNRVNAGVTNPGPDPISVTMRISDKDNNTLHSEPITLNPHQNVQY
jgi:hypothetical protein